MKEIFKILKKYTLWIIIVIVLLFFQAYCNLSLPDYTSRIVDTGISGGGIENNAIEVIRESEYQKLIMFTEDPELINQNYEKITKEDTEYLDEYPALGNENLYILKDVSNDTKEEISDELLKPIIIVYGMESDNETVKNMIGSDKLPTNPETSEIDPTQYLQSLTPEQLEGLKTTINDTLDSIEPSMLEQVAINYVKNEYTTIGVDLEAKQINYIIIAGLKMLGLSLLAMLITIVSTLLSSKIATSFSRDLRNKIATKVMIFSNKEFEDFSTASLITRSTNDIQQVQMFVVMLLRLVIYAPIMGIGAYTHVNKSSMSWVIALAVVLIMGLVTVLFTIALPKFKKVQQLIDKLNLVAREIITGIPVVRAFGNEKHEEERFDKTNVNLTKTHLFVNRLMSVMMPTMMFIMNGVSVLIIWVGSKQVDTGSMQVGTLIAFITYTMQIIMAFLMLSMMSIMIPRAFVSVRRIGEIFNKDISVKDKEEIVPFDPKKKGLVEFKDVYFRYPGAEEDVLKNISFTALPGTTTAFIGSTGSGKSTLINLIPRLYDVTGGKILIDGVNIKDVKLHDLREKIGYVPQKGNLFTGTIKSNIAFGEDYAGQISDKQITKAASIAQAEEFIKTKEKKYDSEISQGGTNVSGGQRQRLAIARAIAIDPEIYIFDDSFSALDYKTDAKLRASLTKETKDSTKFIVAQRISTVLNADQIIVLDGGTIAGIGTHKELMKTCDVYKEIALSQLSKEELENE